MEDVPITDVGVEVEDIAIKQDKFLDKTVTEVQVSICYINDGEKVVKLGSHSLQVGDRLDAPVDDVRLKISGVRGGL